MNKNKYDVIIVGAGYCGSVLSYYLKKNLNVLIIENNKSILKKFLLTGKGYSNITNTLPTKEFLSNIIDNDKFLYSSITKYNSKNVLEWCDELKIRYQEKTSNRIHLTDSNEKFRTYLFDHLQKYPNLSFKFKTKIKSISKQEDFFKVKDNEGNIYEAKYVVLSTGGLSFVKNDIFGSGYRIASSLDHTIKPTYAIGVGLNLNNKLFNNLQGVSATDVTISVLNSEGKIIVKETGNLMFTHFGLGGPVIRRVSGLVSKHLLSNPKVKIVISFMDEKEIMSQLRKNKKFSNCFSTISKKLLFELFDKYDLNKEIDLGNISNLQIENIVKALSKNEIEINSTQDIRLAINTGGGVNTKEISPNSFESKNCKDLYIIGEILDINPKSNGFNLTCCYSMARVCADAINKIND
ncbi:MAG: aminoacetone oxidase family FAD-binding enzyme [Mycoplasma sp.]